MPNLTKINDVCLVMKQANGQRMR